MKVLFISSVSVTIELENKELYYSSNSYDVRVNGDIVLKDINTNVFSLFSLNPNTSYIISVNGEEDIQIQTDEVSQIISTNDFDIQNDGSKDVTSQLQVLIDQASKNSLIVIEEGKYLFTTLKLKNDITLYLKKDAILSASINQDDYKEIDGEINLDNGEVFQLGTWEGHPSRMKESMILGINNSNVKIVGEGIIDGNAQLSTWWQDFKSKPYARPHLIFLNHCQNITIQGIELKNSPQWTVHPYFCKNVNMYDFAINNPKISPNTDGINPQCCNGVNIIGVRFSLGDDCIALKSGKMYIGKKYKEPTQNVVIRNCLMEYGHGAVVLGSEMSGGLKNITVERCIFSHTDRGLRIKTRRGRGNTCIVDGIEFKNIKMINVLNPLVINMFYFCDPDGKTEYVYSKEKLPVDEGTPYLGKFTFKNIIATECEQSAGYFYGLPEMPISEIVIEDSSFSFKEKASEGTPAMMSFAEVCSKRGFIFRNVNKVKLKNVELKGYVGEKVILDGNESYEEC
ncbi:MAG: glycoside hydrolase family 28 protein [Bacilli bacterium]